MEAILETETVNLPSGASASSADTNLHTHKDNEIKMKQINTRPRPYRFKYTDDMVIKLTEFSKENVDADKHEFADAWKTFMNDDIMVDLIEKESVYLEKCGYTGTTETITLKMYRSAKYYFIKKARREIEEAQILERLGKEASAGKEASSKKEGMEEKEKEKRTDTNSKKRKQPEIQDEKKEVKRPYFKVSTKVLESMDSHINEEINEVERRRRKAESDEVDKIEKAIILVGPEAAEAENFVPIRKRLKPSCMYESYCEKYAKVLQEEEARMGKESYPLGSLSAKFKKTFKNRCFNIFAK